MCRHHRCCSSDRARFLSFFLFSTPLRSPTRRLSIKAFDDVFLKQFHLQIENCEISHTEKLLCSKKKDENGENSQLLAADFEWNMDSSVSGRDDDENVWSEWLNERASESE